MAAARGAGGGGGDEVGELSEALRAEIKLAAGKETVNFEDRNDFGDAAAVFLAEKLRGNTIVGSLWLPNCLFGAVGARALANVLAEDNTTLKHLSLSLNPSLADDGAEATAQMLRKNTTLEVLGLGGCGVGDRGARALGEALKENHTLRRIFINSNQIGDDGANALAEALRWNESLEGLSLGNCRLTNTGASSVLAALRESNSTLTSGSVANNYDIISSVRVSTGKLLKENKAVFPATAERRARCLLFCCLQLASTAHQHVVPSIGAMPVPVMQYAVEHAGKLHVAKRFEHDTVVAGHSSAGVRARSSSPLSSSDSSADLESATSRRR
jgi:hypothetical protein